MNQDDKLEGVMQRWGVEYASDAALHGKVLAQVRREEARATLPRDAAEWLRIVFSRPLAAGAMAAVFVLAGVGLSHLLGGAFASQGQDMTLSYRLSIDPLYRLQAMAGVDGAGGDRTAAEAGALNVGLDWLQSQLQLTDRQYKVVSALHETYEQSFDELFIELLDSYAQYRQVDRQRMSSDVVDYMQLYDLLQKRRELSEESERLTAELLQKVSELITPEQRDRYQRMLERVYPKPLEAGGEASSRRVDA